MHPISRQLPTEIKRERRRREKDEEKDGREGEKETKGSIFEKGRDKKEKGIIIIEDQDHVITRYGKN